jgi:predicted nucleic acid-binding protein
MKRRVVNASVAVKWFVSEKDADKALRLRDSYLTGSLELAAPTLIYYEVANALRFHLYYRLNETELLNAIPALKDIQIAIEPPNEMWFRAFKTSISEEVAV